MTAIIDRSVSVAIREAAHPLTGSPDDFAPLLDRIGDARFVLLGEASHGTHEFYRIRAAITKELIRAKGFTAVAVEADWPDAYRVNRYVRGEARDREAERGTGRFQAIPPMDVAQRRRARLRRLAARRITSRSTIEERAGFYGLDLYSLHRSMRGGALVPPEGRPARRGARGAALRLLRPVRRRSAALRVCGRARSPTSCENEVVAQLVDLRASARAYAGRDGRAALDELFYAEQNARLVRQRGAYYRTMFGGSVSSWNLRDQHMAETLDGLERFLARGRAGTAGSSSGRTIRTWAMPAQPRWATPVS